MIRAITLGVAIAVAGVAASAQEPATRNAPGASKAGRACFAVNDVRSWEGVRGGKFIIRTSRDEFYEATFIAPCPSIDMAQQITIQPRTGSYRICEGDDSHIALKNRGSCRADQWRKLSAEEVAALPARDRP